MNERREVYDTMLSIKAKNTNDAINTQSEAVEEQLEILKRQKAVLQLTLDELQEDINEFKNTHKNIEQKKQKQKIEQGVFFSILTKLEQNEDDLRKKIAEQKKILLSPNREMLNAQKQNIRLNQEHQQEIERNKKEREAAYAARDRFEDLATVALEKEQEYTELCDQVEALEEKLKQITKELAEGKIKMKDDLETQKRKLMVNLARKKDEENRLKRNLVESEKHAEITRKKNEKELQDAESVKTWQAQRKILSKRLIAERSKLEAELKNLDSAMRREQNLHSKFKELLGEDDPGNGTGLKARLLVQGAIDELENSTEYQLENEIEIEREYGDQLRQELALLEKSQAIFDDYKKDLVSSLQEELDECSNDSYIMMLKGEMAELLAKSMGTR